MELVGVKCKESLLKKYAVFAMLLCGDRGALMMMMMIGRRERAWKRVSHSAGGRGGQVPLSTVIFFLGRLDRHFLACEKACFSLIN